MNDNPKAPRGQVHQLRIEHIEAYTTQSGRTRWKVTVSGIVVDVPNGMLRDPRRIAVEMGSILHPEGAWRADDRILDLVGLDREQWAGMVRDALARAFPKQQED